ncbi:hypothetical protein CALVIDRAFT_529381 [Calocera viscosa TUFC12733]|uniref:Uncharacterized protein n=1 Tax=Calocera viscosa (strain TUFC12733) TaxID=1330018 RepID=A0A167JJM1_CALVF|nr:hypothetical protein CALVIDRAFT_529381 [Calocera viscosa TUFC12733]
MARLSHANLRFFFIVSQLPCLVMSVYIGVGWNGTTFPGWVKASRFSNTAEVMKDALIWNSGPEEFEEIRVLGHTVPYGRLARGHIDCMDPESEWIQSLIPRAPFTAPSPEYVANVKCVFSVFQLAYAAMHFPCEYQNL